jgi:hypothetical protein
LRVDAAGRAVLEQRLSTTPKGMREVFGAMPHSRIALENRWHKIAGAFRQLTGTVQRRGCGFSARRNRLYEALDPRSRS